LTNKGKEFVKNLKNRVKEKAWKIFATLSHEELEEALDALTTLKAVLARVEMESREAKESEKPLRKRRIAQES
jgi:DNA-binding MarR family transcriptional regulator